MQPIFLFFLKIFSAAGSKPAKYPRITSKIRKKRAAAAARNFCRSKYLLPPVRRYNLDEYPPDKYRSPAPEMPRCCQAQTGCLPALSFSVAAVAKNRTRSPESPPIHNWTQSIWQPLPAASTEQTADPAAALTGFFIAKGGYRPFHSHLTAIH